MRRFDGGVGVGWLKMGDVVAGGRPDWAGRMASNFMYLQAIGGRHNIVHANHSRTLQNVVTNFSQWFWNLGAIDER